MRKDLALELADGQLSEGAREAQRLVPKFDDKRDVTLFERQRGRLPATFGGTLRFAESPTRNGLVMIPLE